MPNLLQRLFEDPDVVRERERSAHGIEPAEVSTDYGGEWKKSDTVIGLFLLALIAGIVLSIATNIVLGFSIAIVLYLLMLLTFMAVKE